MSSPTPEHASDQPRYGFGRARPAVKPLPVIGLDVGGTAMKGLLVRLPAEVESPTDADAGAVPVPEVLAAVRRDTPVADGPDAIVATMADAMSELRSHAITYGSAPPAFGGAVAPGIVDEQAGVVVHAVNLGLVDVPLAAALSKATDMTVVAGHDVRAGGLAEATVGAGRGHQNVLFVPLGTGIAASCLVDGHPLVAGGYAGELGHVVVVPDGEPCPCGQRGCLERYASAAAIARHYNERSGNAVAGAAEVAARLADDPIARQVWDSAIDALSTALVMACAVLGPEVVVIGGGLARAGEALLTPIRAQLDRRMTFHRRPTVVPAALGDQAGALGAAIMAARAGAAAKGDAA
jgi:glucokinase